MTLMDNRVYVLHFRDGSEIGIRNGEMMYFNSGKLESDIDLNYMDILMGAEPLNFMVGNALSMAKANKMVIDRIVDYEHKPSSLSSLATIGLDGLPDDFLNAMPKKSKVEDIIYVQVFENENSSIHDNNGL